MDATAIEEMNRVRAAMGLKPLPVPGAAAAKPKETSPEEEGEPASTIETRTAASYDNFKKVRDAEKAKKEREERAAAIRKARENAQRLSVLEGKGLGDLDDDGELDAKAWLKSQKKRQKKIEKTRQEEQEAAAAAAAAAKEYTSRDLAGVKVAHDMSTFLETDDQILTLKDTTVLDDEDEGDELENLNLREREKLQENLDLKKKRPVYDPNNIDETGERSVLAQYDEEINGKKKKLFTLDAAGGTADIADILEAPVAKRKLQTLDIDIPGQCNYSLSSVTLCDSRLTSFMADVAPASDYLDISEIKVKKPKKKKSKSTRQKPVDDDDTLFPADQEPIPDQSMDIDSGAGSFAKRRKITDDNFVDDDDLQSSLALQRRAALKKRKRMKPEDIAKQLKEEVPEESKNGQDTVHTGGLVIDEISGFVDTLKRSGEDDDSDRPRKKSRSVEPFTAMDVELSEDEDMENAPVIHEEHPERELTPGAVIGEEEKTVSGAGLGSTLALLKDRGLIEESGGAERNDSFRQKQKFLAERHKLLAQVEEDAKRQRERDRKSGLLDRMSAREREDYARKQNADREYKISQIMSGMYKDSYKPSVELKYFDEYGRALDQKEAFKHLSHQFHGKGSGAGKTDKKLKKIREEQRRESQSILDASQNVGMSSATAQQLKKRREAGVRLA